MEHLKILMIGLQKKQLSQVGGIEMFALITMVNLV